MTMGRPTLDPPVAIVGMGCRFPGGVGSPAALWRGLCQGFDAIGDVPADRFDAAGLGDRIASGRGGFLDGIDQLDADFFGLSPREAERLDPQQRLLLETAWEAVEDAGIADRDLAGTGAGVFVGLWRNDYEARVTADPGDIDFHMTTGTGRYSASGRLSYLFDVSGPSLTVDTHCSSSLVAVHLAVESLANGETDLALAGGANVILDPTITIAYSRSGMLSSDGRSKFGDASADGYVRSEGAGVVVLKRLPDALAAGDRIHAVIRGSAVVNDGRSSGSLAAPGRAGQVEMLRRAIDRAGVEPTSIHYVEAHGTGTAAGDPVELGAIGDVLGSGRSTDRPCLVGSVKSNVGHTEAAAGVAGLIKATLAVREGEIPASQHIEEPNPAVAWSELGIGLVGEHRAWPAVTGPRRAGVSSFGITGTNAHVVIEQPPDRPQAHRSEGPFLVPVSAATPTALRVAVAAMAERVANTSPADLAALSATACRRRSHHQHRVAVVGSSPDDIAGRLRAWSTGDPVPPGLVVGRRRAGHEPRVGFVFSGQGPQWWGMGRDLLASSEVFGSVIERCDGMLRAHVSWSLLEELGRGEADSRLAATEVAQPALFALQTGLVAVLADYGISPQAVVGHSVGEIAAANAAGVLDLESAIAVVARRGRRMQAATGKGSMASVDLPADALVERLAAHPELSIAALNAPSSTVVGGPIDSLDAFIDDIDDEVPVTRLPVDYAFHHPSMAPHGMELRKDLAGLAGNEATITFASTVTGAVEDGLDVGADHWSRGVVEPVRFAEAIGALLGSGIDTLVEIGPHPVLRSALAAIARSNPSGGPVDVVSSLRRGEPDRHELLMTVASLHCGGSALDWEGVLGHGGCVDLPAYPWQRQRHWFTGGDARVRPPSPAGEDIDDARPRAEHGPGGELAFDLARRFHDAPTPAMGTSLLQQQVGLELATVLRSSAATVDPTVPMKELGLDSLLALEFTARLTDRTGVELDSATTFNHPTVTALAAHLAQRLGTGESVGLPVAEPAGNDADAPDGIDGVDELVEPDLAVDADVEGLTSLDGDAIEALLADELAAVDELLDESRRAR